MTSDPYLNTNSRNIFLTTFGKWDSNNRIYSKIPVSEEYNTCIANCKSCFSSTPVDVDTCHSFCQKLKNIYIEDSGAAIICKNICNVKDIINLSTTEAKCIIKNKSKLISTLQQKYNKDEPNLIMNLDIMNLIIAGANKSLTQNTKPIEGYGGAGAAGGRNGDRQYTTWIIMVIVVAIILILYFSIVKLF